MRGNFRQTIGLVVELVGVAMLTGFALKSECDRHKTAVKLIETEFELACTGIDKACLKMENKQLKKQLEKYQKEEVKEEA